MSSQSANTIQARDVGGQRLALTCQGASATIVGTAGDDVIDGTSGADVIVGLGGDDVIRGGEGDDIICVNWN